ncbi:MAG: hypothetical protein M3Z16_01345, partial [Pseudomonadota bacterium]|nr:hypothetical protein [Pseudomonadota bacterium]
MPQGNIQEFILIYRPIARCVVFLAIALAGCGGGGSDDPPLPPATVPDAAPIPPAKVAVTAVGAAQGVAIQKMVPTAGDTVVSADGRLTIEIPAGALAAPTMISIQPLSNQSPGGLGTAYRLGPDGITFTSPVKLTFTPASGDLRGTELPALRVAWQSADGHWNSIKAVKRDDTAKTVSVET